MDRERIILENVQVVAETVIVPNQREANGKTVVTFIRKDRIDYFEAYMRGNAHRFDGNLIQDHRRGYKVDYVLLQNGIGLRWVQKPDELSHWIRLPKAFVNALRLAAFPIFHVPEGEDA